MSTESSETPILRAGLKEATALATAQAADPAVVKVIQVTADRSSAEVRAGLEGQRGAATWSVAAYCKYYWHKTKDWCGGVVGTIKW